MDWAEAYTAVEIISPSEIGLRKLTEYGGKSTEEFTLHDATSYIWTDRHRHILFSKPLGHGT